MKRRTSAEFLRELLGSEDLDGVSEKIVFEMAETEGHTEEQIRRAAKRLGVVYVERPFGIVMALPYEADERMEAEAEDWLAGGKRSEVRTYGGGGRTERSAYRIRAALQCGDDLCGCSREGGTHCPAHSDRTPSFSVKESGGKVLVHCFAGCSQTRVIEALKRRGLW